MALPLLVCPTVIGQRLTAAARSRANATSMDKEESYFHLFSQY